MPLLDDPWLPYNGDGTVDPVRAAVPIAVFRFTPPATLDPLPNVLCQSIDRREGPDVGRATFRYDFASGLEGAPTAIEEAMSTEFTGALVVEPGDRLVVQALMPSGDPACLFDGVALGFGMQLAPGDEDGSFRALGIAIRCSDMPISSALVRSAATPATLTANVQTQLDAHFNPGGKANATLQTHEFHSDDQPTRARPLFIDPLVVRSPAISRLWTVPMAVRYLLYSNNDESFVLSPDAADINALMVARVPKTPTGYDPADPTTFDLRDLLVPDLIATGKDWPSTVHKLVGDCGFSMIFQLNTNGDGTPQTVLGFYRPQAAPIKDIYLAPRGNPFDARTHNFDAATMERDLADVANGIVVRGAPVRYEVSVVLAPGFPSSSSDGSAGTLPNFDKTSATYATTDHDKYRVYVFDEAGDGHYAVASTTQLFTVPSLDAIFGAGKYAASRRKPIGKLFSKGPNGNPLDAKLSISTNYAGTKPGVWDGTGAWQPVVDSTWSLLPDRLGIRVDAKHPNSWKVQPSTRASMPYPAGVVKGVESQCGATGAVPFFLRLTCVIEADACVQYVADRRDESPLPWTRARLVDARDRIKKEVVHKTSEQNDSDPTFASRTDISSRDDSSYAQYEAVAIQMASQSGVMDGSVSIPRFTGYYAIGDRIASIEGRGLGFRTDGDASGLNLVYPTVVGIRWDLDGEQRTTLTLSDAGADRGHRRLPPKPGRRPWTERTNTGARTRT